MVQCYLVDLSPWVILHIEQAYRGNKHPLVNRELLALTLKEGSFNIPHLETKVQAFRLNTTKRLFSGEAAQSKCFTSYLLRYTSLKVSTRDAQTSKSQFKENNVTLARNKPTLADTRDNRRATSHADQFFKMFG